MMALPASLSGTETTTVAEMRNRPSARHRFSARMFDGASGAVFRGMATLALGSGIGRVIGLAAIPMLTRLYTPEDFGVLALFMALVAILAPLVTLRYVLALPLPRHDGMAMALLVVSIGFMLVLSAVVALALWLGGETLLGLVSMQVLAPWWWLIALGVIGTAVYEMLTLWATRKRAYKVIAQTNVTQSAAGAVLKIVLGLASVQPLGLLVGQLVAQVSGIGRLMHEFMTEFGTNWRHIRGARLRKAAWRYRGFPIYRVPSQFVMVIAQQSPLLFIASHYGSAPAGQFALALMVLRVPIDLLSRSVSQALFGEISAKKRKEPIWNVYLATVKRLLAFSVPTSIVLWLVAEPFSSIVFGNNWNAAGLYIQHLAIYSWIVFVTHSVIPVLIVGERQRGLLGFNLLRLFIVAMISLLANFVELSIDMYVFLFAVSFCIFNCMYLFYITYVVTKWSE